MQLYPVSSPAASTIAEGAGGTTIVAIVADGLVSPTGRPLGLHEVSALAAGGTAKIRTGDTVLMLKVVGVVKASVRRDGRIQAQGSPADYARLGVVEERLDRAAGPGSIAEAARRFPLSGPVMGQRTRVLTAEFVLRAKSDIPLKRVAFLLDRSWLADLAGGEGKDRVTVRVRVIEYWVTVEGQDVRRAAITSIRQGTAAAGLPAAAVAADTATWIAEAVLDICGQAA